MKLLPGQNFNYSIVQIWFNLEGSVIVLNLSLKQIGEEKGYGSVGYDSDPVGWGFTSPVASLPKYPWDTGRILGILTLRFRVRFFSLISVFGLWFASLLSRDQIIQRDEGVNVLRWKYGRDTVLIDHGYGILTMADGLKSEAATVDEGRIRGWVSTVDERAGHNRLRHHPVTVHTW